MQEDSLTRNQYTDFAHSAIVKKIKEIYNHIPEIKVNKHALSIDLYDSQCYIGVTLYLAGGENRKLQINIFSGTELDVIRTHPDEYVDPEQAADRAIKEFTQVYE